MRVMISAAASGRGKTVMTMGLIRAMGRIGASVNCFKCGPDYIDPMFHERVLGVPCRNLDTFIMGEDFVRDEVAEGQSADFTIIEGAMGLYDGLAGTRAHSAYETAALTGTPIILVINVRGEKEPVFDVIDKAVKEDNGRLIRGVIFNNCPEEWLSELRITLARSHPDITTIGYVPEIAEAELSSRHLGLVTAFEVEKFEERVDRIADVMLETLDFGAIAEIGRMAVELDDSNRPEVPEYKVRARIGVAKDEAFCFYYQASFDNLVRMGAEIVYFSPLHDEKLPEGIDAMYFGGGYPELYGKELEANESMRLSIKAALRKEMPCIAECGGFMYLGKSIADADGNAYEMVGYLNGESTKQEKLVRFGYAELTAKKRSMMLFEGDVENVHEFHYWDSTENGDTIHVRKPLKDKEWDCAFTNEFMYAGYPHLFLSDKLADRFVRGAFRYRARRRWDSLGKPLRSLERLEEIICDVAAVQKSEEVYFAHPRLYVMCADNGVVAEGISQSGQEVTSFVAQSLARGDSTVCHLAKTTGCEVIPVDIGINNFAGNDKVWNYNIKNGTDNLAHGPAMSISEAIDAIEVGMILAERAKEECVDVLLIGEMGIGNTTTSSAVASVLLDQPVDVMTGRGAGLSDEGLVRKIDTIIKSIDINQPDPEDALDVLAKEGGLDIAGLAGIIIGANEVGIPVIIDGFITDVAALVATRLAPESRRVLLPSHKSMEPACGIILDALELDAIVTANMHLGEGGGAVAALTLLQMALRVYNSGHTFDELGIDAYTPQ